MARRSSEFWQDPEHIFQGLASQVTLPGCIIIFLCFWYVVRALDVVLGEQRCEAHAALGPAGPGKAVTPDRHLLTRTTNSMCHIDIANLQSRSLRRIRLSYYMLHLSGLATATRERCSLVVWRAKISFVWACSDFANLSKRALARCRVDRCARSRTS